MKLNDNLFAFTAWLVRNTHVETETGLTKSNGYEWHNYMWDKWLQNSDAGARIRNGDETIMSNNKQYHIENGSEIWNDTVTPPTVEVVSYWVMLETEMIKICDSYEQAVEYIKTIKQRQISNNKQQTIEEAAERILSKEGIKLHPSGLETYLKGNVINAMVEMVKWQGERMYIDKDITHLQWIYDRMSNVHGENKNYDYMPKFKEIIEQFKK
jgi:hypothetical protein